MGGNELIVQGGLEAGFSLYTGYPGSPLADYFNILFDKRAELEAKGIKVVIANSEANAAAMASGAKQAGRDCMVAMKSMGLHVASDALSVGNFANPGGSKIDPKTGVEIFPGIVIVVGDDPWSISTSTPADSRYLFKHLHIPFFEPSTPQELKDWVEHALYVSKRTSVYQGLLLTTFMAEGGGRVEVGVEKAVDQSRPHFDPKTFDLTKNVMVPPNSLKADVTMIQERFPRVQGVLAELALDKELGEPASKVGLLSTGAIFETLKQVLEEGEVLNSYSVYKAAGSFPLVDELIVPWLKKRESVIVVEEKRGFLESELIALKEKHQLSFKIYGKSLPSGKTGFVSHGGLNYELIRQSLLDFSSELGSGVCGEVGYAYDPLSKKLPKRLPTFCPGCPHRETLSLLKDLRKTLDKEGIQLISHGDVGCYSLSFLEPFKEMHNLSAMGQGGALGAGMDMFTSNPSVVLMGDSTFFHSGLTDISNSVQCGHNITYILLDNDNTAMTGHQFTPSTGMSVDGRKRPEQDMLGLARNLGVETCLEVNPSDRYFYKNTLNEVVRKPGVKVIVSNKECGLTFHGRRKSVERKVFSKNEVVKVQEFFQINTEACEDCRVCVDMTGCPGLTQTEDAYGPKISIDPQICVADSYCTKIKVCPSFEKVQVFDYHPNKYLGTRVKLEENLPEPKNSLSFDGLKSFRVVVTGVGGSGVTTISRVLAEAAKEMGGREDLDFKFVDQKGLAQRNGNVTAHLCIFKKGFSYGAVTPLGSADLLVSPDLLDGSGHINFLGPKGLAIFDRGFQTPLSIILDRALDEDPLTEANLRSSLKEKLGERLFLGNLKDKCQERFGKAVYSSAMILGAAYQSGRLPFSHQDLVGAFTRTMRREDLKDNLEAFELGREEYYKKDSEETTKLVGKASTKTIRQSLVDSFMPWQSSKIILAVFDRNLEKLKKYFPKISAFHLAKYLHDILLYDRGANLEDFMKEAGSLFSLYGEDKLLKRALRTLAKTYFIKDEVFVAHQMISPLMKHREIEQYSKLGSRYKTEHINRPHFDLFGKSIEFDINPKEWMLKLMRHMRIFRLILPSWHKKEKAIARRVRTELLEVIPKLSETEKRRRLVEVENIKGYREVRYDQYEKVFGEKI